MRNIASIIVCGRRGAEQLPSQILFAHRVDYFIHDEYKTLKIHLHSILDEQNVGYLPIKTQMTSIALRVVHPL
jgi:hypothetical protein